MIFKRSVQVLRPEADAHTRLFRIPSDEGTANPGLILLILKILVVPNFRMNKTIAGYHLLMILSAVDYRMPAAGDTVIRRYLVEEFPIQINLDREMAIISALHPSEWEGHFLRAADDFFDDATEEERHSFLDFAVQLAKADNVITHAENRYLNILFEQWEPA